MNKTLVSILIVFCLIGLLPTLGSAATNQGLEWGVEVGDRFDYHVRQNDYSQPAYSFEFDCYFVVESLPTIQDNISEIIHPIIFNVTPDANLYFANGTAANLWKSAFPQMIVPVGNWSLWSVLLEDYAANTSLFHYDSINISETATSWTWIASSQFAETNQVSREETATFRKSDGVLNNYHLISFYSYGDKKGEYRITRAGYFPQLGTYLLLVGFGVAIVAAVILYRKK